MADPGKDKKRSNIKIEHGKLVFGPQQNQQQNITSYPSFLLLQTIPNIKRNGNQAHTHTNKHKLTVCTEEWPIPIKTRKDQT